MKESHKDLSFGLDLLIKDTEEHTECVYLAETMRQFAVYRKTHEIRFLNARMIRTMESKNIQVVLGLNAKAFGLQPLREGLAMPLFDHGINTTDGEAWQHSRSLIKPIFSRVEICNLSSLESHFGRLLDLLPQDGSEVDLHPVHVKSRYDIPSEQCDSCLSSGTRQLGKTSERSPLSGVAVVNF